MKISASPLISKQFHRLTLLAFALAPILAHAAESGMDERQMGSKYSPLTQITSANVSGLELAWEYHTGEVAPKELAGQLIAFEDQPSLIDGNLVVCSVSRRIIALDPKTGVERWVYEPKGPVLNTQKCRGVSHWVDREASAEAVCRSRIVFGTSDYRLIAIDAKSGQPCAGFGDQGIVQMKPSQPELFPGEVVAGSAPAVVNDVIVVGSAVADNQRVAAPSGRVLAFDARTGTSVWEFDPVPRAAADPAMKSWAGGTEGIGQGNVWSSMAVDQDLDLVYLPTTSASDDFFGGGRVGDNHYTSSVVALKGSTGEVVWHFQFVHHNVFDYDTPSQPLLIDYPHNGMMVPALVQNTKMGLIFIFNRATGEPLVPIVERPVPQVGKVAGEVLSPTQPFPEGMPVLAPHGLSPDDAWGFTFFDKWLCRKKIEGYNYGPIYTPPSERGTIFSPSSGGGPNWGGGAYDPVSNIMVVPSNRVPMMVKLIPRAKASVDESQKIELGGPMTFANAGSPYVVQIEPLLSVFGAPCTTPPWATLAAVDVVKGELLWEAPLGNIDKMAPFGISMALGTPGAGGPLVTAGGLVFIGYTLDDRFHAFDLKTGKLLWQTDLPAAATSIPVTYQVDGEQFVVIPAGGHSMYGSTMGDSVLAYKLKSAR